MSNYKKEVDDVWKAAVLRSWVDPVFKKDFERNAEAALIRAELISPEKRLAVVKVEVPQPPSDLSAMANVDVKNVVEFYRKLPDLVKAVGVEDPCKIPGGCSWSVDT